MPSSTRSTPDVGHVPVPSALASLGDIAARLAASGTLSEVLPGALEAIRLALRATECALWLRTPEGLVRSYVAGDDGTTAEQVARLLDAGLLDADGLAIARLTPGERRLGCLSVRADRPLETGFLLGALRGARVCLLLPASASAPGLDSLARIPLDAGGVWRLLLAREMKQAGLDIDLNKAL